MIIIMLCSVSLLLWQYALYFYFFFFSSRRRHTRCREVSWARRCVQETEYVPSIPISLYCRYSLEATVFFSIPSAIYTVPLSAVLLQPRQQVHIDVFDLITSCPMYSALIPVSYTHLTLPTILLVQISVVAVSLKKNQKPMKRQQSQQQ
eukprot:TRINITY_DN70587_c0_g1_i1.p2 TRINITY_DN70587_c0_g1~~TRINITY_DN70587_c0_g1_i1.p2  ORF type:complete len:149 (-),score=22.51 TRINITY_DN70587_c0_g1_i1:68-514(-)